MILLFSLALLFLFISTSIGWVSKKMIGKDNFQFHLLQSLLTGTAALTVYLNVLSIFLPTNYLLLIPVFIASVVIALKTSFIREFRDSAKSNLALLFAKQNWVITSLFLVVLILFTLVPPYNADSSGYHFLSILWIEKFKAVPGLANLFPQYGYNSSFFVLSAAFSFTDVFHQSVYPVNSVLIISFFLWMLKKSYGYSDVRKFLIWCMLIVFLRQFPINLASPSADALSSMIVFYILFRLLEAQPDNWDLKEWSLLLLLSFFSVIVKLSTLPLLLVAFVPFIISKKDKTIFLLYLKLLPVVLLIVLPWLIRNIILSGYLIFPYPAINIFTFDWKVPVDIAIGERLHIAHAPRMVSEDWRYVDTLSIFSWFPKWLVNFWKDDHFNCLLTIAGLVSPVLLLIKIARTRQYFIPWIISYTGVWFWMITSPDIRFGYHYLLPALLFPLFSVSDNFTFTERSFLKVSMATAVCMICLYHTYHAVTRLRPYMLSQYFYRPLRSPEYFENNDLSSFKYVMLNGSIRLYIPDSSHNSINAPLPVCFPYRKEIKMRGNKLEDGFKTQP